MQPIQNLLNKIKWDKRENPEEYSIFYYGRILKDLIEIPYEEIKRVEGTFMVLGDEDESNVPLQRVKKVTRDGYVVWQRE